jgi:hypothetical protein
MNYQIFPTTVSGLNMPTFANTPLPAMEPALGREPPNFGFQCYPSGGAARCLPCSVNDDPRGCLPQEDCQKVCSTFSPAPQLGYGKVPDS